MSIYGVSLERTTGKCYPNKLMGNLAMKLTCKLCFKQHINHLAAAERTKTDINLGGGILFSHFKGRKQDLPLSQRRAVISQLGVWNSLFHTEKIEPQSQQKVKIRQKNSNYVCTTLDLIYSLPQRLFSFSLEADKKRHQRLIFKPVKGIKWTISHWGNETSSRRLALMCRIMSDFTQAALPDSSWLFWALIETTLFCPPAPQYLAF